MKISGLFELHPIAAACALFLLSVGAMRADIEWRVSVKIFLDSDGSNPSTSGGDYKDPAAIRDRIEAYNAILKNMGRGYQFKLEVLELSNLPEWFKKKVDPENRSLLESEAKNNRTAFQYRDNAINVYVNDGTAGNINGISAFPFTGDVIFMGQEGGGTTMLHEIGHYFGLCHTHGCGEAGPCEAGNDFIDDTILDAKCWDDNEDTPDVDESLERIARENYGEDFADLSDWQQLRVENVAFNLMSNHPGRRNRFTPDQLDALTEHSNFVRANVASGKTWFVDGSTGCLAKDGSSNCISPPSGGPFESVPDALDQASSRDLVLIRGGSYDAITINQPVTLRASCGNVVFR